MVFQFGGFFGAREPVEPDRRTLLVRALETCDDVGAHLCLTEILVRELAALDAEDERSEAHPAEAAG